MKRAIPSAAMAAMPNCGHTINLEEPDENHRDGEKADACSWHFADVGLGARSGLGGRRFSTRPLQPL